MTLRHFLPRPAAALLGLALAASTATAGGINLSWDDCGAFGAAQKNFACNSNLGNDVLYVSVIPNFAMAVLNGHEGVLTVTTPTATLPNWWQRQTGGCRAPGPPSNVDFSANVNCRDVWAGQAVAGQSYDYPVAGYGANQARIRTVSAVPSGSEPSVDTTQELYIVKLTMSHVKSTGAGACAGCTESACIVLQSVTLVGPLGAPTQTLSNPILRQHVFWQSSAPLVGCPGATPARNRTWGSVKTLYR